MSVPEPGSDSQPLGPERTLLRWRPPSASTQLPGAGATASALLPTLEALDDAGAVRQAGVLQEGALPAGALLADRYVIEGHVSSGSFGAVYKAADRLIENHAVAIKVLHGRSGDGDDAALRELRLIAAVAHPSVVQFKDYGWVDQRLWFAMPWYEGETLEARLTGSGGEPAAMSRHEAQPIFERLAHGLAAMHSVGVHHHDLKPDNIFLSRVAGFEEGLPVLLDLGIAATQDEQPTGFTAQFTAPETAARALGDERGPIGEAADVYSLALTLRAALEPQSMPDMGHTPVALLMRRANTAVPPPSGRSLRYLAPHFERWLSLDSAERPSARAFARELFILTEPEARRDARRRLLRRMVPFVLMAAMAVGALGWRLRDTTEALSMQRALLSQQVEETERLRTTSAQTLAELEDRVQVVGEMDRRLAQAIEVGRTLDRQLGVSNEERRILTHELTGLRRRRAALRSRHKELEEVHQGLTASHRELGIRRDRLKRERNELRHERDLLGGQRDALSHQRDGLVAESEGLRDERDGLRSRVGTLGRSLASQERQLDQLTGRLKESDTAREQLRVERDKLSQDMRAVQRRLARRDRHQPAVPETRANEAPSTPASAFAPAPEAVQSQ